jgi:hypothetical protein
MVTIALVALTVIVVSRNPTVMPLCFPVPDAVDSGIAPNLKNCPTRSNVFRPTGGDIWVVALLGLLGGALAATVAIRKLQGSSTPYDVPVALAWLKVPLGAFMAILGLVAIQGGFIPGLTALDSQEQILAWALLLGFAQQLFTGVLDQRAQDLLGEIPSKDALLERHAPGDWPADGRGDRRELGDSQAQAQKNPPGVAPQVAVRDGPEPARHNTDASGGSGIQTSTDPSPADTDAERNVIDTGAEAASRHTDRSKTVAQPEDPKADSEERNRTGAAPMSDIFTRPGDEIEPLGEADFDTFPGPDLAEEDVFIDDIHERGGAEPGPPRGLSQ